MFNTGWPNEWVDGGCIELIVKWGLANCIGCGGGGRNEIVIAVAKCVYSTRLL